MGTGRVYMSGLVKGIVVKDFKKDSISDDVFMKPIYRTDIEKALDEMISNEEGMRFQGLAVVLAKQRWPELIASERKKDLGLDAYVPAYLSKEGVGKGLACSLTATIEKIKKDINGENGFKKHVDDVNILLFATPKKVTKEKEKPWKETVFKEFGIKLQVLSREDIITDLMLPNNAAICRAHLNIHFAVQPTVQELINKARKATSEILDTWLIHPRLAKKPKIALQSVKLDKDGRETHEVLTLEDFQKALLESRRIVLEAPAGRGKTTTLVQLVERYCAKGEISFLVNLPEWIESNDDILEFIAKMPSFRSSGIDANILAQIYKTVPCSFLLNGWNEVSDNYSDKAVRKLGDLERNFPNAGIIVATRSHHIRPPLPGSFRAKLLLLNRQQRRGYLSQVLESRAGDLISQLESDRVLDELTRTPLILAEVAAISLTGAPIPKTKAGVLDAVMRLVEESEEHRDHLVRSPLRGNSRYYLTDIAIQTTARGTVTLGETDARSTVNSVSRRLQVDGQIATLPEPLEILSGLCAHHVLERIEYPTVAFRFQHQQFQEWYVSMALKSNILELVERNDRDSNRDFTREYVNKPFWEEPLRMIAEEVGALSSNSSDAQKLVKAGNMLVEFALEVDPVFAAELARLCGSSVRMEVRNAIGKCLRACYQTDSDPHRRYALAGMFASGSEDFKDIFIPLLTSDDQQIRLRAYRSFKEFQVSSLGENWKQIVKTWKEDHRADFIGEVEWEHYMAGIAEEFARTDPSFKVKAAALRAIEWVGAVEFLSFVLASYDDNVFEEVLRKGIISNIPPQIRPRAIDVYNSILQKIDDPKARLRIRLSIAEIGGDSVVEGMKEELNRWPSERIGDGEESLIRLSIELIKKHDSDWVSQWVTKRIVDGLLWSERWVSFISNIPQAFIQELLKRIEAEDLQHKDNAAIVSILVVIADVELVEHVFSRLCSLRIEPLNSPSKTTESSRAIIRQLEDLFRAIPVDLAVSGILRCLSSELNQIEHQQVVAELFGKIGDTGSDLRSHLSDGLRKALRTYFKAGVPIVLSQNDYNGCLKSELATALSRVGEPEDMDELKKLIQADIERLRRGREARRKGDRGPMGNGAVMSYSNWHVRGVECLDPQGAEDILLQILCEPEYEEDAAKALIRLARTNNPEERSILKGLNYRVMLEARAGRLESSFDENRRCRYANAIKQRIAAIKEQRSQSDNPDLFNGRLKMLASVMAILDGRESHELVMEIMALPGQWDGYTRVEALKTLLLNGVRIKVDMAFKVLDPTINHILQSGQFHDQQNCFLLQQCLCLLPFLDPPSAGIARIKEVITATQFYSYNLREILAALGNSRCDEALDLLLELSTRHESGLKHIRSEWIDAIAALDTTKSRNLLMGFVDSDVEGFSKTGWHLEFHDCERIALYIAGIAREEPKIRERLYVLCAGQVSPEARILLAGVVSQLGSSEALIAGLSLIHDQLNPPIPYVLSRGLESAFLGKKPYDRGHVYTIEPTNANEIRSHLYEMAIGDVSRKRSAWELLGQIEFWRLEYGRPDSEPRHPAFDSGKPWPSIVYRDNPLSSTIT
jgi:hypothetical protein